MGREHYHHLTWNDRLVMETMLNNGATKIEVAEYLHIHLATVYREAHKGRYMHLKSDYTEEERYSADLGQQIADENSSHRGKSLKIGSDICLANRLEELIVEKKYSPEAALKTIELNGEVYSTTISVPTLYRYIDAGIFFSLSNADLPVKKNAGKKEKAIPRQKRASAGDSIEKRPRYINKREEFGHWEMDTVKGKQGVTKGCLLVLSERKTREELIFKMKDQTAKSVVKVLNRLEKSLKDEFYERFKTITVDNGVEFSDVKGLEQSKLYQNQTRTKLYYCHAYCSSERGTNENINRMIRRFIPKGTDIDVYSDKDIRKIQNWINNYPRRMFGFQSSQSLFEKELKMIS